MSQFPYTNSKAFPSSVAPGQAIAGQEIARVEPLLTPEQLVSRYLKGISLFAANINLSTGQRDEITSDDLKDYILRAITDIELETGLTILPVQFDEKHPFDKEFWRNFGYLKANNRPILSVEDLAFTPATGTDIFVLAPDWIEPSLFYRGQVNIIPLVPAAASQFVQSSTGSTGNAYLTFLGGLSWIPAIIRLVYTAGFPNGKVSRILNEVIGMHAATDILSQLAATNKQTSYSLGADGLSQSVATPGPEVYDTRIEQLTQKKEAYIRKIKSLYGLSVYTSYI